MAGVGILFALLLGDLFGSSSSRSNAPSSARAEPGKASSLFAVESFRGEGSRDGKTLSGTGDSAVDLAARASQLNEENVRLRTQNNELQGRLVSVLNWILENFRGKYPLSEIHMAKLQIPPMTEDFTLHPDALDFLKVTPDEERKVNDAFAYAHQTLEEIEAAIITVTNPRPDKVILQIPTFPEEGKALQDDLYSAIDVTLGPARFDRFLTVAETGLNSNFAYFGEASRTMVFELAYAEDGSAPQLKIKDGWVIEVGPGTRSVTATETYVTNLPAGYSTYMPWLPEYIAAYANPQNM